VKVVLLCIGDTQSAYLKEGISNYLNRIKHYAPTEFVVIEEKKAWKKLPPLERKKVEGEAILAFLESTDHAVLLDENGNGMGSRQFAERLEKLMLAGNRRAVFIIGGAFGFSDAVYSKVKTRVSLSQMTFNHEMVRLFMLEQLYRAFSILRGEPYHND
jgi:23S rRNA (pseudouridine1915-N3)-methyltransferase